MAITAADLLYKYSVTTGSAGNSAAGTAAGSLGKYISTTSIANSTANALFADVTSDENANHTVEYRCVFLHNNHATLTLQNAVLWLVSQVTGGADIAIAVDNIAASAIGSASAQAAVIASRLTAPTGVSAFSAPTSKGTGLSLGSIGPGQCRAFWIQRTATASAALNADGVTWRVEGDTLP